jgi:hypothetical protein
MPTRLGALPKAAAGPSSARAEPAGDRRLQAVGVRAVERGEPPDVPRSSRLGNLPFDLLRHDVLMTMRPVPDESILEIVGDLWLPLLDAALSFNRRDDHGMLHG